ISVTPPARATPPPASAQIPSRSTGRYVTTTTPARPARRVRTGAAAPRRLRLSAQHRINVTPPARATPPPGSAQIPTRPTGRYVTTTTPARPARRVRTGPAAHRRLPLRAPDRISVTPPARATPPPGSVRIPTRPTGRHVTTTTPARPARRVRMGAAAHRR